MAHSDRLCDQQESTTFSIIIVSCHKNPPEVSPGGSGAQAHNMAVCFPAALHNSLHMLGSSGEDSADFNILNSLNCESNNNPML